MDPCIKTPLNAPNAELSHISFKFRLEHLNAQEHFLFEDGKCRVRKEEGKKFEKFKILGLSPIVFQSFVISTNGYFISLPCVLSL